MRIVPRCLVAAFVPLLAFASLPYPAARTSTQTDDFFGTPVADPYRWLEDVDSAETKTWVAAQNKLAHGFLAKLPRRQAIKQRLQELLNYPRFGLPAKESGLYLYSYNSGLQNQSSLYVKPTLTAEGRLILDPNTLSRDGTVALTAAMISEDGQWLAYGIARDGSDWNEYRVRRMDTGKDTRDVLSWVKFSSLSWTHDSKGFFYSRYPKPQLPGNQLFSGLLNKKIYYHRLGTKQRKDILVYERPDRPLWGLNGDVTQDGRYLIIKVSEGTDSRNRIYYQDLRDPLHPALDAPVVKLIDELEAGYTFIGNHGPVFFLQTDHEAARRKIIAIDLNNPGRAHWKTLVPEANDVISTTAFIGQKFVVNYLQEGKSRLVLFAADGTHLGDIALPAIGTVASMSGREDEDELFFSFTSFTYPTTNFRADLATGRTEVFQSPTVAFDPSIYETKQVFYFSQDGTRVPMFITHRKGLKLDGSNPTLLYGYGGFNVSLQPTFSTANIVWLEQGGVYAVANLRGGGEYGTAWYLAGTKERKQNVFDDFIAAGEYLINSGYTSSAKLVLSGGSNGGLLVGAVVNQRPDLARVALPAVGVMDMLRFHRFTIGWSWISDYGVAHDPEAFKYLSAYSPLHNVKSGTTYPAILVTTGDHDDRVHPGHSFKYAATLQAVNQHNPSPLLIRIETNAGHGAGKPIAKLLEETSDKLAFALYFTSKATD